ncbi:TonB-linked outer membrane protein, SusC/RagA family [Pedobacter sp. ok626]|nr:TonB-linked outer membrane protein, SusC/RagA family [Pedobacter sp. ok626]
MNREALIEGFFKTLYLMRLTPIIILLAVLQLSARDSRGQKLTYNKDNTTISQVFKEIKRQTGYNVVWYEGKLNSHMSIDANFYNTPLDKVMDNVLFGRAVTYQIIGKAIVVKADVSSFRDKLIALFANIDVRGRVLDENNEPLAGAVVKVKGEKNSTSTNSNGEFMLKNVDENVTLVISFLGYETQEVKAVKNIPSIKLTPSTDKLEEVQINAGYYTVTDRERTGSISRITSKDIEKQPINNVLQAMQANIPGIQVLQNTGVPGGGFKVQIRGKNSLNQGNEPFYVIDGVPFSSTTISAGQGNGILLNSSPLASINPMDIENIEVLKDADATAIYGARGANGVILITTKKGKPGKTNTSISLNQGISRVGHKLNLMNNTQYLEMRNEAFANDKITPAANQYDVNSIWSPTKNIDWQEELIGHNAPMTNLQASLSGGDENLQYLFSGSYYKEGTVFLEKSSFGRNSGNIGIQYNSDNKKFFATFSANYSQIRSDLFPGDMTQFIYLPPNFPDLLDNEGNLNWDDNRMNINPLAQSRRDFTSKTNNLTTNTSLGYKIFRDLIFKTNFGFTKMDKHDYSNNPLNLRYPGSNFGPESREAVFSDYAVETWIVEPQINWNKTVWRGKLQALLGTTFQQNLNDGQSIVASNFASDALLGNIAAASLLTVQERRYLQYRYTAVFGRLNYNFSDKYIVNLTARRDGSSRFGNESRFANFGAIGAAWIISQEDFIRKKDNFISFAKLRVSYGVTGNDQISDYAYLSLWSTNTGTSSTYQGLSTLSPNQISNPEYAWEVNKKFEAGIDLGLFKDRINLSFDFYSNRSSNQLLYDRLPYVTGWAGVTTNLPAKVSNTGIEFILTSKNLSTSNFRWNTSINFTLPKNKLLKYPGLGKQLLYEIGQPLSILKVYNTYVNPQTGLYVAEDYDKNGIIDDDDRYKIEFIGRKYYGGIENSLTYKGFKLDFLFQVVKQSGSSFYSQRGVTGSFNIRTPQASNFPVELLDRWQNVDDRPSFQKFGTTSTNSISNTTATKNGSLAIVDASFIRLKNVDFSYTLPSNVTKKIKFNSIRFYLQGQNLFTITKYLGLDPETQSSVGLPSLQVISAGFQITL